MPDDKDETPKQEPEIQPVDIVLEVHNVVVSVKADDGRKDGEGTK